MTNYVIEDVCITSTKKRKSIIYIWERNESIIDNLRNRRDRPRNLYLAVVREALNSVGINPDYFKFSWQQSAGCACGCSPGFVVNGLNNTEISISVINKDILDKSWDESAKRMIA